MTKKYQLSDIDDQWQAVHQATLLFLCQDDKVLLIRKKRGLGAGKINGPGGKRDAGESLQQCAVREVREELRIEAQNPVDHGRVRFQFTDGYSIDVRIYVASSFTGVPQETDEAIPLWFKLDEIPYAEMWEDDQIWLPRVLGGESVDGRFVFESDRMLEHAVTFDRLVQST